MLQRRFTIRILTEFREAALKFSAVEVLVTSEELHAADRGKNSWGN
jgi:hypothetical protein